MTLQPPAVKYGDEGFADGAALLDEGVGEAGVKGGLNHTVVFKFGELPAKLGEISQVGGSRNGSVLVHQRQDDTIAEPSVQLLHQSNAFVTMSGKNKVTDYNAAFQKGLAAVSCRMPTL